jgi:hypothetical protein
MTYTIIFNADGVPAGFVHDEAGLYTEQQARDAVLCSKLNPTAEEIAETQQVNVHFTAATEYKRQRAFEYPPITDYIDGVVKGDQAQIDAYIAACQAVKAKYPKGAK